MASAQQTQPLKPANRNFERAVRESFAKQGLMGTVGAWLLSVAPGEVVIELPYSDRISQQHGLFHGAAIGALADTAGGYAALSLMAARSEVLTVEYKINFTAPAKGSLARAHARVARSGKTLAVVQVDVTVVDAGKERICAVMQATMMRAEKRGR